MNWRRLFNIGIPVTPKRIRGEARTISAEAETGKGVFLTPQSLVTFPGSTFAVGLLWKVIITLMPAWKDSLFVPFFLSLGIGLLVYLVAITEPNITQTRRDRVIGSFVALVNTFYIFASVTGISLATNSSGGT